MFRLRLLKPVIVLSLSCRSSFVAQAKGVAAASAASSPAATASSSSASLWHPPRQPAWSAVHQWAATLQEYVASSLAS